MCEVDNKKIFNEEASYSTKCEACGHFCKIWHYRSCTERHEWNIKNGIDIYKPLRDAAAVSAFQTGQSLNIAIDLADSKQKNNKTKQQQSRRGR